MRVPTPDQAATEMPVSGCGGTFRHEHAPLDRGSLDGTSRSIEGGAAEVIASRAGKRDWEHETQRLGDRRGATALAVSSVSGCTYADLYRVHGFGAIQADHLQVVACCG